MDIELGKRRHHPLPLARRFYAQSEYEWLCALPAQEQESAFYRLWSRKEAVLKAHGGGIAAGLEKVRFVPEQGWRLDNRLDDTAYQVQDWPFASGWLSLAAATTSVTCYQLDERLNCQSLNPMLTQHPFGRVQLMIVDITPQNFHAELIDASMKKPVVIYFHAPQMPECQGMTPLVESLVGPANEQVTLAKVDMNDPQLQPLASQLGLRALPALVLFHQGRPDEQAILEGPQDEATLRHYFAAFAPKKRKSCWPRGNRHWLTNRQHRLCPSDQGPPAGP
ncbi:4'-phosphopantetheinyl transferase superfamily protein [Aeromonas sp. A-5]|uniref:4'-phosphopantetheinyl transferase superfamily protein n=1 Tax=Aeromonas ichthyocola TaxID=3367746 RepID=UPI0038DA0D46